MKRRVRGFRKGLTKRELTVLRLYAVGFSIIEVANRIQRHPKLVQWTLGRLRKKFKVRKSRELPIRAFAIGLVDAEVCRLLGYTREIENAPTLQPIQDRGATDQTLFVKKPKGPKGNTVGDE